VKVLVDTSPLLWLFSGSEKLSKKAKELFEDNNSELYVSLASYWEICIKISIGKLILSKSGLDLIQKQILENQIRWLPISINHCSELLSLPFIHSDPFDRIIIAQAKVEEMSILTPDKSIKKYKLKSIW
jgi:PIN domain nuclease of toxin-antitoxin system